jgi:hypothetical protein
MITIQLNNNNNNNNNNRQHAGTSRTHLSRLVRQQSALSSFLPLSPGLKLGKIPVIITLHLEVKYLGLGS